MKKRIAMACSLALMISLTGCGQSKETSIGQLLEGELSGEITVSCFDTMFYKDFLEKAAKSFEEKYPGTKINVESFAEMPEIKTSQSGKGTISIATKEDDSQERADYISKINTELMGGGGADVLAIDILPYYKYADSGLLENLQEYMEADSGFEIGDYRSNIIEALKYKDGQYILPLDYMFDYMAYDSSLLTDEEEKELESAKEGTSYEKLFDLAKGAFERENTNPSEPVRMIGVPAGQVMLEELMLPDYAEYIDITNRKVSLDDGRFASLLETIKKYGEDGYLQPGGLLKEVDMSNLEKMRSEQFFFKSKNQYSLGSEIIRAEGLSTGNQSFSLGGMASGDEKNDKILGLLSGSSGNKAFDYLHAFGINSNSANKALAWAFVKYLMSEEIQSDPQLRMIGLPINNAARAERAGQIIAGNNIGEVRPGEVSSEEAELTEPQRKAVDLYNETVEAFSDALNYFPLRDDAIDGMIRTEVRHFFDGSKSSDEVAEALQKKIELYLNE